MAKTAILLIASYLMGGIPTGYLIGRLKGIDIRKYGSGNVGAANVLRVVSKWSSLLVIIFDIGKGMVPVYIARTIDLPIYQQVIIGLATISGHNWPIFMKFKGGKGASTTSCRPSSLRRTITFRVCRSTF